MERWRKPAAVIEVSESPDTWYRQPDGRVHAEIKWGVDEDTFGRFKSGYLCVFCLEPFETPWPASCICGDYSPQAQRKKLDEDHSGERFIDVPQSVKDYVERQEAREHFRKVSSTIAVPRGFANDSRSQGGVVLPKGVSEK